MKMVDKDGKEKIRNTHSIPDINQVDIVQNHEQIRQAKGRLTMLTLVERISPADPSTIEEVVNVLLAISFDMAI